MNIYQAKCNQIGCGWKGARFSGPNSIADAYNEKKAHEIATVEELATGMSRPHSVYVRVVDDDSRESEVSLTREAEG